jgi:hypothetical protein
VSLYVVWSKFLFIEIIPYFAIIICNAFIITKITKSARFRRRFDTASGGTSGPPAPIESAVLMRSPAEKSTSNKGEAGRRAFKGSLKLIGRK